MTFTTDVKKCLPFAATQAWRHLLHCYTALLMTFWFPLLCNTLNCNSNPQSGSSPCRLVSGACVTASGGHFEHRTTSAANISFIVTCSALK